MYLTNKQNKKLLNVCSREGNFGKTVFTNLFLKLIDK